MNDLIFWCKWSTQTNWVVNFSGQPTFFCFSSKFTVKPSMSLSMFELTPNAFSIARWNKLHFASARAFVYLKMFAVHNRAHKNCVLMLSLCTAAKISAKMPLCQAVYKIQIRTNPQCFMSTIAIFNSLFFKAIPCKSVQYWVPMFKLQASFGESSLHVFLFWLWQGCLGPLVKYLQCWDWKKIIYT